MINNGIDYTKLSEFLERISFSCEREWSLVDDSVSASLLSPFQNVRALISQPSQESTLKFKRLGRQKFVSLSQVESKCLVWLAGNSKLQVKSKFSTPPNPAPPTTDERCWDHDNAPGLLQLSSVNLRPLRTSLQLTLRICTLLTLLFSTCELLRLFLLLRNSHLGHCFDSSVSARYPVHGPANKADLYHHTHLRSRKDSSAIKIIARCAINSQSRKHVSRHHLHDMAYLRAPHSHPHRWYA